MKRILAGLVIVSILILSLAILVKAHTPLCSCYDNGDGTITCEGGFSDGSSASGVSMTVKDKEGDILLEGKMDEFSEFTFDKPEIAYKVIFDAGPGHVVEVKGEDITE
jgi:hypothetical protein